MFKVRIGEIVNGEPLQYTKEQEEFFDRFNRQKVIGCFDLPGLGKTLEILGAICQNLVEGDKALVVVPPHLLANWFREIELFTYLEVGKDIDVFPYTQLGKKVISFQGYRFVAGDEAHYLKNMDAKRTFNFMTYLEQARPEFYIHATGTPVANRIPELYTFLLMLSGWEHVYPKIDVKYPTYYQFCERFCHVKSVSYGSGVKYHGMKNVDELKEYLKPWTIRRAPDLKGIGMKNETVIAAYGEGTELAKAWEDHASDGNIGGIDIVAKKNAAIAKAPFTAKWVYDAIEEEAGPIVVFSDHPGACEIIHDDLKSCGLRVAKIIGGVTMKARDQIVQDFQAGKLDAVTCSSAGYTGITLTRSNLVVVNDPPWKPDDLDQLRRRVLRKTQTRPCRCVYIAGSKADDQIINTLRAKLKVINAVVEE